MASRFLIGRRGDELLWACVDEASLCASPTIAERRFAAYLAPFADGADARRALLEAGADTITDEIRPKRGRHG